MKKETSFWKTALSNGLPFGLIMGIYYGSSRGLEAGIIIGLFQGFLFGCMMAFTFKKIASTISLQKPFAGEFPQESNMVFSGLANHFKGLEARRGFLYLTQENLIFKPSNFNIQKSEVVIPLNEIDDISPSKTLGVFPNSITISTKNVNSKFVVENRDEWVKQINILRTS